MNTLIEGDLASLSPQVTQVELSENQIVIHGDFLENVNQVSVEQESTLQTYELNIVSQTSNQLVLTSSDTISLTTTDGLNFIFSGSANPVELNVAVSFQSQQIEQFQSEFISDASSSPSLFLTSSNKLGVGNGSVNASLLASVNGRVGAEQLCDENGANCILPSSVGSGTDPWTDNTTSINYSGGNVGIGSNTPGGLLDISNGRLQANVVADQPDVRVYAPELSVLGTSDNSASVRSYILDDAISGESRLGSLRGSYRFELGNRVIMAETNKIGIMEATVEATMEVSGDGTTANLLLISSSESADGDVMIIQDTGEVGIGTSTPQATLDVNGFMRLSRQSTAPSCADPNLYGVIALNNSGFVCVCTPTGWLRTDDGATTCAFAP